MSEDEPRMLVMTQGHNGCIYAFPPPIWKDYMDRMMELDMDDEDRLDLMREVLSQTSNSLIDAQWRVKLPEDLAHYAKIDREVEITGLMDRIELWNPEVRKEYQAARKKVDPRHVLAVLTPKTLK